jgi:hypothetical protein
MFEDYFFEEVFDVLLEDAAAAAAFFLSPFGSFGRLLPKEPW